MAIQFLNTVQVDTDVLYVDTANDRVGIGETSPSHKVDIKQGELRIFNNQLDPQIILQGSDMSRRWVLSQDEEDNIGSTGFYIAEGTSVDANEALFYLEPGGNLGIGTTIPLELLHLSSTGPARLLIEADTDNVTETDNAQIILKQDGGAVVGNLGYKTNTNGLEMTNQYVGADGILTFGTRNTERMRVSDLGNVGIGTTSPNSKLQVDGTVTSSAGAPEFRLSDAVSDFLITTNTGGDGIIKTEGTSKNIRFFNNSGETMRISGNGDVGIGTTSPSEKLVVRNGTSSTDVKILAFNNASGTEATLKFSTIASETNYEKAAIIARNAAGSFGRNDMHFALDSAADSGNVQFSDTKMTILNGGNVGIGTTSPTTKLHVNGNLRLGTTGTFLISQSPFTTTTFYANAGNGSTISFGVPSNYQQNVTVQGDFSTQSGSTSSYLGTKRFGSFNNRLDPSGDNYLNSGDLGIGTTSPSYKLDVSGEGRFTGDLRCLSLIQTSQRDQKENINDIDKSKAKAIPFKEYTYKSSIDGSSRKRYGVVVEDIEDDYPELVHTDADGVKGVNYIDLLVKRVAELEKELEDISLTPGANGADGTNGTNGSPGAKGATGSAGSNGKNGSDGNSHLSNITSIGINRKSGQLEIVIGLSTYKFNPDK